MDTSVSIKVVHHDVNIARDAIRSAFCEMVRIENLMSVFKNESEVYHLNKKGYIEDASDDILYVIRKAEHYSKLSEGAFAVTVLPLLDLWKEKLDLGAFPTVKEIEAVLPLADYRNVHINGKSIKFSKVGTRITLGGIAKGYAVDRAVETLKRKGVKHALINAGGDIRALGDKMPKVPWKVGVRDPKEKDRFFKVVDLENQAIATSGGYERFIGSKAKVSHIVNARTGQPSKELLSATVITKKAIDADALSTVFFLLGVDKSMKLMKRLKGVKALLITNDYKAVWLPTL